MTVRVVEATPVAFKKFGKVFKVPKGMPTAESAEFRYWSDVTHYSIQGETEIGWCVVYRQPAMTVTGVERHVQTPEILIPVDAPFILPVLTDGDLDNKLEAFKVDIGEAIVIREGVWHGACLPLGKKESSYFVIFRKGTPQEDVAKRAITGVTIKK